MNLYNLNSFLKFGYFIDYENPNIKFDFSGINKRKYQEYSENELIQIGSNLWKKAIEKSFKSNQKHVVPLSGGLDSRAILGGLLEFTEADNIYTYTFGTPCTLDYEIGNYIAKKIGTKHIIYPLTKHTYTLDEEIEFSKRINHQTILFHHPPVLKTLSRYADFNVWTGFMGGELAGSHVLQKPSEAFLAAKENFIEKNSFVKSISLSNGYTNFQNSITNKAYINQNLSLLLNYDDYLDFEYRQLKYIEPHVLVKGFKYKLPFIEKVWFDFMLSIPEQYRYNQSLYIKILTYSYPKLSNPLLINFSNKTIE